MVQETRFLESSQRESSFFPGEWLVKLRNDERAYVWRPDGTRFAEEYVKGYTFDKRSHKFWGIISSAGQKTLVKCPECLKSVDY